VSPERGDAHSPMPAPTLPPAPGRRRRQSALIRWLGSLVAALAVLGGPLVAGALGATVTDLGAFIPIGLNSHGVVVGDVVIEIDNGGIFTSFTHAAMWSDGTLTRLPERAGVSESEVGGAGLETKKVRVAVKLAK
jgi:hypothetical protein